MRETIIHKYFSTIQEPRINRTKKHPLLNIIFIALCAVICGAEDWVSIERLSKTHIDWFTQFLDLTAGIPSHDTFNRVFSLIDSEFFAKQFIIWAEYLAEKLGFTDGDIVLVKPQNQFPCLRRIYCLGDKPQFHYISMNTQPHTYSAFVILGNVIKVIQSL